jgi:CheY-like chemotaxis protein
MAPSLDGMRILVVDDDDDSRFLLTVIFKMVGASVTSASSAIQALASYQVDSIDLLVSDIKMPEIDGYELIRAIRASENETGTHVVAISVTGTGRDDEAERSAQAGYDAHVARPVEPDRLLETVRRLRQSRSERSLLGS